MSMAEEFYSTKLEESGFQKIPIRGQYNPAGKLYQDFLWWQTDLSCSHP